MTLGSAGAAGGLRPDHSRRLGIYAGKDGAPARGWTEVMAKTVSKPPRAGDWQILRQILIERGFKME